MSKVHDRIGFADSHPFRSLIVVCVLLGGGCQMRMTGNDATAGVQSRLRFTDERDVSLSRELAATGATIQEMTSTLSRLGATDEDVRRIVADPFHSATFRRVRFLFTCEPSDVVGYYSERLRQEGWTLVRGILLSEHSNAGGDWVEVYGKGPSLVRVHVYGYRHGAGETPVNDDQSTIEREVTFDFINLTAAEFFGWPTSGASSSPPARQNP